MSTYEVKGHMTYKDKNGDLYVMYPATKIECIEGFETVDTHMVNVENPHEVTAEQTGAVALTDIATVAEAFEYLGIQE